MNELYDEISSSDEDEEEESSATNSEKTTSSTPASAAASSPDKSVAAAQASTEDAGGDLANPFKRQVSAQASEALKELYGDDYEAPIGFEEAKTEE